MKLLFLGTGAGNFRGSRRQPSSALLENVLLDCGAGATGRLHDSGAFDRVDVILISHLHTDHIAGLPDFLLHTLITGRRRPLTIVSPPGLSRVLEAVFEVRGTVVRPSELYEFHLVEGEAPSLRVGDWSIRAVPLDHTIVNFGYLLTNRDRTAFYTGDTREPSGPADLRADWLIHEATFADEHADLAHEYGHSTGTEAAEAAVRLKARRLFLNHLGDQPNADAEILREARRVFPDATVVEDRQAFDL